MKTIQEYQVSGGHGGRRNGAGRPKGRIAKETADIKAMVVGALQTVGGTKYLARQAEKNPVAFMSLVGRVLPLQVTGENGGALLVDFRWADAPVATVTIDAATPVADETEAAPTIDAVDTDVVWSDGNEC